MLALILAMICSATIGLIFKYSERAGANRFTLTSANYFTAALFAALVALPLFRAWPGVASLDQIAAAFRLFQGKNNMHGSVSVGYALWLGVPAGLSFFLAFLFYQLAVGVAGVSISGALSKIAVVLPICASLLLWQEQPNLWQWSGVLLATTAIAIASWPKPNSHPHGHLYLLGLFFCMGLAEFSKKLFQKLGDPTHKPLFLLATFSEALVVSLIPHILRPRPLKRKDLILGIAVGIPNLLASYFLITALANYPAAVIFPMFSAGTIVCICVMGHLAFGERLGLKERWSIALVLPALLLLNL